MKGKKLLGGKILRAGKKILPMLKNNIEVIRDPISAFGKTRILGKGKENKEERKKGKNAGKGKGNKGKETKGKDDKKESGEKTTPAAPSSSP